MKLVITGESNGCEVINILSENTATLVDITEISIVKDIHKHIGKIGMASYFKNSCTINLSINPKASHIL